MISEHSKFNSPHLDLKAVLAADPTLWQDWDEGLTEGEINLNEVKNAGTWLLYMSSIKTRQYIEAGKGYQMYSLVKRKKNTMLATIHW